jgi:short-subunit dehydrogenase
MRAVVTGAAQGIGFSLARLLSRRGDQVLGIDRDKRAMSAAIARAATEGWPLAFEFADLGDSEQLDRLAVSLCAGPPIDLLVHNAGISHAGPFAASDLPAQEQVVAVNLRAPVVLTKRLLAARVLSERAAIVFISSLSHYTSYPGASVYAATKDGLASFARSLRAGGAGGRPVLTVFPGPVRTEHARRYSPDNSREHRRLCPDALAVQMLGALSRGRATLVPGLCNRIVARVGALVPAATEVLLARTLFSKMLGSSQNAVQTNGPKPQENIR